MQAEAIDNIKFGVFSPDQIRKMSVAKLTIADTYNEDGYPIDGGLLDQRLGVIDPGLLCKTCGGRAKTCPGHFGHIELVRPVLHPEFSKIINMILQATCQKCHRLLINDEQTAELKKGIETDQVDFPEEQHGPMKKLRSAKTCPHCKAVQEKLKFSAPTYFYIGDRRLKPDEIRDMLAKVSDEDLAILGIDSKESRPEWFVLSALLVPPVDVRPSITLETGERSEDDLTHKLVDIMRITQRLEQNINAGAPQIIIDDLWELLQYHVTTYFNNETGGIPPARHRSGRALKTIAQRLRGKEGRFRYNLSGKRVNYSARTVISVDPNVDISEVGVPRLIAEKLTTPFYVTAWNIEEAKRLLDTKEYPSVLNIVIPDGKRKRLLDINREEMLKEIAPGYILERQLRDGDIVLLNRQPSLHRVSIMAHRVKVLPGKTFRINICTTMPYNADFDGDEMNLHVPQTLEAQAEAIYLMAVQDQVFSPRDGNAIIANQDDGVMGLYLLTQDNMHLNKDEVEYLLGLAGVYETPKESKKGMYSGKAIFSLLLPKGFSFEMQRGNETFKIKNGVLVEGAMTKRTYGPGNKMFVNIAMEYGFEALKNFLYSSAKLANACATLFGVTIGIKGYMISDEMTKERKKLQEETSAKVSELIASYKSKKLKPLLGYTPRQSLEQLILAELEMSRNRAGGILRKNVDPSNPAMLMVDSGARASLLNFEQMSMFLGQQAPMEGGRIKRGYYSHRILPHILPRDISPQARGFVRSSFLEGLTPIEMMMHATGGRATVIHKGLLTPRSGYLQRRLANALQDYYVYQDNSVRDVSNNMIETVYGGDAIDPTKVAFAKADGQKKNGIRTEISAGEPVGVIAAQSVGEPGTQMILKTFHLGGIVSTITTTGLPRIVELLDAKKKPSNPISYIYLEASKSKDFAKAEEMAKKISEVRLKNITRRIEENFSQGKILITLDVQVLEQSELTARGVAAKLAKQFGVDAHVTSEGNIEVSAHTRNLKGIRSMAVKMRDALISGVDNAGRAVVSQERSGEYFVQSAGSNIEQIALVEGVDKARLYTNDVFEMYRVFGIEAARNTLIYELMKTVEEQDITLDPRHIMLIADAMTSNGTVQSIGRHGLVGRKESVFARAAFEETIKHIVNAAAFGEVDHMRGITENILIGKQIPLGTGSVKLAVKRTASKGKK